MTYLGLVTAVIYLGSLPNHMNCVLCGTSNAKYSNIYTEMDIFPLFGDDPICEYKDVSCIKCGQFRFYDSSEKYGIKFIE